MSLHVLLVNLWSKKAVIYPEKTVKISRYYPISKLVQTFGEILNKHDFVRSIV